MRRGPVLSGDALAGGRRASPVAVGLACCTALAATPMRLVRPRPVRRHPIALAAVPPAAAEVRLQALVQARMHAPSMVVAEGVLRPWRTRMAMTTYVIEHPAARFLVDPALCADVFDRVVPGLPAPFRFFVTPERPVIGLGDALDRAGIRPEQLDFALPTHLHWDHVSGLLDLPELAVRLAPTERSHVLAGKRVPVGFVRPPIAGRTWQPYELDGPAVLGFARSLDLFGDGAVVLVDLPGHTPGSVGVLLAVTGGRRVLLAGDAIWHARQIRGHGARQKAPFPGRLVDHDRAIAFDTVRRLAAVPAGIDVIAAHDHDAAERWT